MIPRWQMIGLAALVLLVVALAIYASPNSYAHAWLWGRCRQNPMPAICLRAYTGVTGPSGMAHMPVR